MVDRLSAMERQAVRCTQEGMTNAEIAARLGISPHTARNYLGNAYEKLGLHGDGGARTKAAIMLFAHDHETHATRLLRPEKA